ncbi:MAG: hypothetical protein Tsb008_18800 [Rhodothalassiaceae bacterium]
MSLTGPGATAQGERGIALVLVLWVLALLSLIIASFLAITKSETDLAQSQIARAEASALADGGVHWAVARLAERTFVDSERDGGSAVPIDGSPFEASLPGGTVLIRVYDVSGLIDLNAADAELLRGLFIALGTEPVEASRLAARVVDYRDTDDRPLPGGAEEAEYRAAGLPWGPRNGPFQREDELRQVVGMPASLASALDPYVTVSSGSRGIDPEMAPEMVLAAVPGLSPVDVGLILDARRRGEVASGLERLRNPYLVPSSSGTYRIFADARSAEGGRFIRDATIQLRGAGALFSVRHWGQARADQMPE